MRLCFESMIKMHIRNLHILEQVIVRERCAYKIIEKLCDKVCQWLATGQWFSLSTLVSSTNKSDLHNIAEILLKGALNTKPLEKKSTVHFYVFRAIIYI